MSKRFILAANWKMYAPPEGWDSANSPFRPCEDIDVLVFPSFLWLQECAEAGLNAGAQCGHPENEGAHTGSVSMEMIAEVDAMSVLCGHSERRRECGETDELVMAEAQAALSVGLLPIVCVGETAEERTQGQQQTVVSRQLLNLPEGCVVAYEPVWAIGSGVAATPEDISAMHTFIKSLVPEGTRVLYGGSVTAENAQSILSIPTVDGCLVGGASRKIDEWKSIVDTAATLS